MLTRFIIILTFSLMEIQLHAQDDLLNMLETDSITNDMVYSFKGLQMVNLQSTKMPNSGDLYFVVSHRFGSLKNGIDTFFGLDNATTKLGFIYGVEDWISLGVSRHTLNKTYEGSLKYRLVNQNDEAPVTLVGYHTIQINSQLDGDAYPNLTFKNRLSY